jgi:CRP-like cAMP-binding protein/FixJ family two-component response regulator
MEKSILIIEDKPEVLDNMKELLNLAGYHTQTAKDGKQGLELARSMSPNLILCDIMMPVLDGYGVLRALRNIPELSDTPFVFTTAKTEKSEFRAGMDLGADDYLFKPFSGDELLRVVEARIIKKRPQLNGHDLHQPAFFQAEPENKDVVMAISGNRDAKKIRKGEHIYMEGDSANFMYFLSSGKVKTFKTNEDGKEYLTQIHNENNFFGYISLFNQGYYHESAIAIEDSSVILIPKENFFQLLRTNGEAGFKFVKYLSESLEESGNKLLKLAYDSARKRVADALLFVAQKYLPASEEDKFFPVNRENISSIAGISFESVSRNLTDFKSEGLIETNNGLVKITNFKKLETLKN